MLVGGDFWIFLRPAGFERGCMPEGVVNDDFLNVIGTYLSAGVTCGRLCMEVRGRSGFGVKARVFFRDEVGSWTRFVGG